MRSTRLLVLAVTGCLSLALATGACSSEPERSSERVGRTQAGVTLAEPGFVETTAIAGLNAPTVVRFAADGRVFVAEKGGKIKVFDDLADTTATVVVDLATRVHDFWDRGLLGMTLAPDFPNDPYLYVLYAYDGDPGDANAAPKWGDQCPTPPGATADGCVISGRLSRFELTGDTAGNETVLIEGWRQQYPSHATGQVEFGPDGALYASGGDGASFNFVDYGQDGNPINPLADPPVAAGVAQTPPDAQGGALRSQSVRRPSGPVLLNGSVIRVDPATGAGKADNPFAASSDVNAQRILAYGLRNPFRIAARPGKQELWIADVGWNEWEELNRIPLGGDAALNFGWPCYEGAAKQAGYDTANLTSCEALYTAGGQTAPYFTYRHSQGVSNIDGCGRGSSSVTGIAFYNGTDYPAAYQGALFFADYSRRCIYMMEAGAGGDPDPVTARSFHVDADGPVFLTTGPGNDLFYAAINAGSIQRISYLHPVAAFSAAPTTGQAPLIVMFDGTSSVEPLPEDELTFAWDLDGDGQFDDSSDEQPAFLYDAVGSYDVRLKVTDERGTSDVSAPLTIVASAEPPPVSTPPMVVIDTPSAGAQWKVGDSIEFSGHATDAEDGELPASALSWQVVIQHCPDGCHIHELLTFDDVASGSFAAEDHDYPMHLELILTATDSSGQKRTARRSLDPSTVSLVFDTIPSGLQLVVGPTGQTTPFARRVISGSENSVSAPETQELDGTIWRFQSWSDGKPQSHQLSPASSAARYIAVYAPSGGLLAEYYDELAFGGMPLTRIDPVVDFNWGTAAPAENLGPDTFSVRWTGEVLIDFDESYTFTTLSDDGVRLAIDGVPVIDNFTNHAPTTDNGVVALTPGWHPIVLEYYESGGGAQIHLSWASASQLAQIVPESHLRPGCGTGGSCTFGLSCNADEICVPTCDPASCNAARECRLGTAACVLKCHGVSCPTGDVCKTGLCVDKCTTITCDSGQHCKAGVCIDDLPPGGSGGAGGQGGDTGNGGTGSEGGSPDPNGGASPVGGANEGGTTSEGGTAPTSEGGTAPQPEPMAGAPGESGAGGTPSSEPEGGRTASGGAAENGGAAGDAGSGTSPPHPAGGCTCGTATPRQGAGAWLLLGLVLLGRLRRRS